MNADTARGTMVVTTANLFAAARHSLNMRPASLWMALALLPGLIRVPAACPGGVALAPHEARRVDARQVVVRADLDANQRRGMVRAAVRIGAPAEDIFRKMILCADALQYVPHLRKCQVREQGPDTSWLLVEQEIDFGWYAPRV